MATTGPKELISAINGIITCIKFTSPLVYKIHPANNIAMLHNNIAVSVTALLLPSCFNKSFCFVSSSSVLLFISSKRSLPTPYCIISLIPLTLLKK